MHRHSVDPLSLSLTQGAAANVGGDCLVRAKLGIAPGAWTRTAGAPKLWKVIAELDMAGSAYGLAGCVLTESSSSCAS